MRRSREAGPTPLTRAPLRATGWTSLPEHWVWPVAHTPVHVPATHVWFAHAAPFCQAPLESQLCGCVGDVHCPLPGLQATQSPFRHAGIPPEQAAPLLTQPPSSHVCGWAPLQPPAPAAHEASPRASAPESIPLLPPAEPLEPPPLAPESVPPLEPDAPLEEADAPSFALASPLKVPLSRPEQPATRQSATMGARVVGLGFTLTMLAFPSRPVTRWLDPPFIATPPAFRAARPEARQYRTPPSPPPPRTPRAHRAARAQTAAGARASAPSPCDP